ncbi:MAG: alcohol dehydrogenase catalytic domain-containing protein [Armatimonadota bacterium]|nr:alcohol dehydrogenase catalytic domain-containing protein [Armatimonadota bacterium]MDR7562700.1 alcohol dehydrogenase catalytic domain-containing protein [Armatimonadota bacterium]MDR7567847.1 alcohol dehydrogenase catalytic domain-containing protein [Armatimonadota bacterium]MDR7602217.1 alcohol dehydrogenase catalytic domain-containing protein [Armatimonadota bacterium]
MSPLPATMKAAVLRAPDEVELKELPTPLPGRGEVVIRVRACGICGSDLMDWYVAPRTPFVFGHELSGEIAAVGEGVTGWRVGDPVFVHHHAPCGDCEACLRGDEVHCATWRASRLDPGGMAEYVRVPPGILDHDTLLLPPEVGFDDAALTEPVACAVKALRRADRLLRGLDARGQGLAGARVLLLGVGFSGQILGTLARRLGVRELLAADPSSERRERARRWADEVLEPEVVPSQEVDLTVVAAASATAVASAVRAVRPGGVILLYAPLPPGVPPPADVHDLFFREITLLASYSAGPRDTREALRWITDGEIRATEFITHRFPLHQVQEAYRTARAGGSALKVLVEMG